MRGRRRSFRGRAVRGTHDDRPRPAGRRRRDVRSEHRDEDRRVDRIELREERVDLSGERRDLVVAGSIGHVRVVAPIPVVSDVHELYFEESGNPVGMPVVFLHGGPGGGTTPEQRRFFDPAAYHIVLFDQRGCGRSHPLACLEQNTTWDLVDDIDRLRAHLDIKRWVVFGGSCGSTPALAYSERYPESVRALVLRGIFLLRPSEIRWSYQEGASNLFRDAWEEFIAPIERDARDDLVLAYRSRLLAEDPGVRLEAARAWCVWEARTSRLLPDPTLVELNSDPRVAEALARIECHYFTHGGFLAVPDQLLEEVGRIRHIPARIVQGRYDVVCPMTSAWDLHRRWPEAGFEIVPDAGHTATEPGTTDRLIEATDHFRDTLSPSTND